MLFLRPTVILTALLSCEAAGQQATPAPVAASRQSGPELGTFGVDLTAMDRSVAPGDDFWSYVNGGWARSVEIPPDRGVVSQPTRLTDLAFSQVRTILDEFIGRRTSLSPDERRAADYYRALIDQQRIEAHGAEPLLADLRPIRAARTHSDLAGEMGKLAAQCQERPPGLGLGRMPRYFPSLFPLRIAQDSKDPSRYVASMGQGGLGLPGRDFYLKSDSASTKTQSAYRVHLANMLQLVGVAEADATMRSAAVYDFERGLAEAHWSAAESRNADKAYNPWLLKDFSRNAPGFDWSAYLGAAGMTGHRTIIVRQAGAINAMAGLYAQTPLPVLKDWLSIRVAKDRALALPQRFRETEFGFSGTVLSGASEPPARWLEAAQLTSAALTDAVARPYVARHFPAATKAAVERMVSNVLAAMDRRFANLSWMAPQTRAKARAKLATFTALIGYPEKWRSYAGLQVVADDAYGNLKRAGAFDWKRQLDRIDGPVDRAEWLSMPMAANAEYSLPNNQIIFPAAYLQPPHFDPQADAAVNYGGIGYIIGHEISHHFDDQGSKYDPDGRLNKWWTDEDLARYTGRQGRLVAQYDAYEVLPGLRIRGAQVLGENIADNVGLAIAYDAYKLSLGERSAPVIDGFTGDQRFFLGRAQVNKAVYRDEELRRAVLSGVHSPARWRTWSVRNHDAWYDAFAVEPTHKLYLAPEQRVKIWE